MGAVDHGKAKAPDVPRITEADGEGELLGSFRAPILRLFCSDVLLKTAVLRLTAMSVAKFRSARISSGKQ
jgi:hypothetical protein